MRVQRVLGFVIVGLTALVLPSSAEACSCGGTISSSVAFNGADVVFVGRVARLEGPKSWSRVNADGSISGGPGTEPPVATFEVAHVFRGPHSRHVVVIGDGTSCDQPFKQGEAWLVYARTREGRVTAEKCGLTRLRAANRGRRW